MAKKRQVKKVARKKKPARRKSSPMKYVIVTGGIVSGIGKGLAAAAIATLLKAKGVKCLNVKVDPYLNRDAGTMNPYQHGEVFVLDDGTETDLDLGHYERFSGVNLDKLSNFTTGAVYESVMKMERRGDFLGKTIQIIPHVTDEIKRRIAEAGKKRKADVVILEIGGTVGDIEAEPYIEAARQMFWEHGRENLLFIHVVKIDYVFPSEEEKTKPIQQSVKLFQGKGIQPDFLIVRSKHPIAKENKEKIALFTNVRPDHIIPAVDAASIYDVPIHMKEAGIDRLILKRFGLSPRGNDMRAWTALTKKMGKFRKTVKIALIGKYVAHADAYMSVEEALKHAAVHAGTNLEIVRIDSERPNFQKDLKGVQGIVVPGGFGKRGGEGKIKAVEYARKEKIPFLGLCLGLQIAVIEYARHVAGLKRANSTEFDRRTPHPVIDILPEQLQVKELGGTMRLGAMGVLLKKGSKAEALYGARKVSERHRHRYEVNPEYREALESAGLVVSGVAEKASHLVDMIELPDHPFFIATQAHPEFLSRFMTPHPLFLGLLRACLKHRREPGRMKGKRR